MTDPDAMPAEKLPFFPRRKKFLIPIGILFAAIVIGLPVGIFIGFSSIKSSKAFKLTMDKLEASESVKQYVGLPIEPSTIVIGRHDDQNGTYELSFKISGSIDKAVVRSWCVSDGEGEPWQVTHLSFGIGGREGQEITLVGDPKNPPWSTE
ncbi:MAG: cytochrome c oxidase assembly factor Coa1 family protein [Phycisphaeraceae bacterium]